ncbi:ATP-binding protein [Streptomyces sp. NPDC048696]|uniref:ATP-binding protein n=1 Tax=Streptomyces sp. NPDC048696 TaxID=3365585 RepID=UPI00371299FF
MPHPTPTPVALYACIHDDADPATVMAALRKSATAHNWAVVATLYDTGPLTRPLADRVAWRRAAELITAAHAQGIVVPNRHHLAGVPADHITDHPTCATYRAAEPPAHHYRAKLKATPSVVSTARHALSAHLTDWSLRETSPAAELILSELLTNAIVHTTSPDVTVEVTHTGSTLHLAVTDDSPTPLPEPHAPTASEEHGRGLTLVAALADEWGTAGPGTGKSGKSVWAKLTTGRSA